MQGKAGGHHGPWISRTVLVIPGGAGVASRSAEANAGRADFWGTAPFWALRGVWAARQEDLPHPDLWPL